MAGLWSLIRLPLVVAAHDGSVVLGGSDVDGLGLWSFLSCSMLRVEGQQRHALCWVPQLRFLSNGILQDECSEPCGPQSALVLVRSKQFSSARDAYRPGHPRDPTAPFNVRGLVDQGST